MTQTKNTVRAFIVTPDEVIAEARRVKSELARANPDFRGIEVIAERIYRFEVTSDCDLDPLIPLMANPQAGQRIREIDPAKTVTNRKRSFEIAYRPSVIDPETPSALEAAKLLNIEGVEWMRASWRYTLSASNNEALAILREECCNDMVEVEITPGTYSKQLKPTGIPEPVKHYDFRNLEDSQLRDLSISEHWYSPLEQMQAIRNYQVRISRSMTDAEVERTNQAWCDHCYHISWKEMGLLDELKAATLEIDHPLCLSIFVDNAGAIKFYGGYALCIKGETHCHPSLIATLLGILTKHGGVFRDIICMGQGAYPIGGSTIMGTMLPSTRPEDVPQGATHPRRIVEESIRGTAGYCNPMGVAMMYAYYRAYPGINRFTYPDSSGKRIYSVPSRSKAFTKCLALGITIGYLPANRVLKRPLRKGDVLILVGGETGRDGIHGATGSSTGSSAVITKREGTSVQIGHPITERNFTTTVPIARDKGWIRDITDLGAGGIDCATSEILKNNGGDIDYKGLPLKDLSLASWEKGTSESQERILIGVAPRHVKPIRNHFKRYNVDTFVLGTCRDDKRLIVWDQGEIVEDLDLDFLFEECPINRIEFPEDDQPATPIERETCSIERVPSEDDFRDILTDYACCDQSAAINQFDSTVQGRTVVGPLIHGVLSDAFVSAPIYDKLWGAISSCAFVPRWSAADPTTSAQMLMALAIAKAIAIGVKPNDLVLCGNYFTATKTMEEKRIVLDMVRMAISTSKLWSKPFISGKDSSSGYYELPDGTRIPVPPTFVPSTLGRMRDVRKVITKVFRHIDDEIYLIAPSYFMTMAGSVAYEVMTGKSSENMPIPAFIDAMEPERLWGEFAKNRQLFSSIAAIGEGGAFMQLFNGSLASGLGADISLDKEMATPDLLGEWAGGFLVTTSNGKKVRRLFEGFNCRGLGVVSYQPGLEIRCSGETILKRDSWSTLVEDWQTAFEKELAGWRE